MGRTNVSAITLQNHRILQKCLNTDTCRDIFRKLCILVYKIKKMGFAARNHSMAP